MSEEQTKCFVGIDLGGQLHEVCVVAADGKRLGRHSFQHSGDGVDGLLAWLTETTAADPSLVAVAMEHPRGVLVEALMERRYRVFSINPKQLDRFRDRYSMGGAKSDGRDALVLADSLRTDLARFRYLQPEHSKVVRLRELSRTYDQINHDLRQTANQLWDLLNRYFPALLTLCSGADQPWLWALLSMAPLPAAAARLKRQTLEKLLKQYRISRFSADDLCKLLRATALPLTSGSAEAIAERVQLLLPRLVMVRKQLREIDRKIQVLLDDLASDETYPEHRDVTILLSLPGVGRGFTATVLSEAPRTLATRDYGALRVLAGTAPITKQSGKTELILMRQACNHRIRQALHHAVTCHIQKDERAYQQYKALRQRGHSHGRAVRGVGDRLLAVMISMLKQQTPYDSKRRQVKAAA